METVEGKLRLLMACGDCIGQVETVNGMWRLLRACGDC